MVRDGDSAAIKAGYDVVVLGEVLIELSSTDPLGDGISMRLGCSGDALNSAAAASSLALGSPGGCTALPTLDDSRIHLAGAVM
jgi:hypothetical protein